MKKGCMNENEEYVFVACDDCEFDYNTEECKAIRKEYGLKEAVIEEEE